MDESVVMGRSISFDKTVQVRQYHPIRFFTSIKDIPFDLWKDNDWLNSLWELLVVQTYKMILIDHKLRTELGDAEDKEEYLNKLEDEILKNIDLKNISINFSIDIDTAEE